MDSNKSDIKECIKESSSNISSSQLKIHMLVCLLNIVLGLKTIRKFKWQVLMKQLIRLTLVLD